MKSCKTCRFLITDSFISPCTHCNADYSHWVEAQWDEPRKRNTIDWDVMGGMIDELTQDYGLVSQREEFKERIKLIIEEVIYEISK